jgi:hypothetical protein
MDARQFDSLSRALGDGLTRRGLVAILGALAGGVAAFASHDAAAAKRGKKRKKKKGPRGCIPNCTGTTCGADGCGGSCGSCGTGLTCCTSTCVNLATDPNNCGLCGRVCASGGCIRGQCTCDSNPQCPAGCTCGSRFQGAPNACLDGFTTTDCSTDDECPPSSVCLLSGTCSVPCT